ncbi:MAG: S16 family serine protease [Candidatus Bathyarchaeia archaeon]
MICMDFRKVTAISLIAICLSLALNVFLYHRLLLYDQLIQSLQEKINELSRENAVLKQSLEFSREGIEYHSAINSSANGEWIYIVGVVSSDGSYKGEVLKVYARFIDGSGRVYIATNPKIGITLQDSAEIAFKVAQQVANVDASHLDLILTVTANKTIDVIDGPSAGAAITVLLASMLSGSEIRRDIVITGAIQNDGSIKQVGGILEKAKAAAEAGAQLFLVPMGQSKTIIYIERITKIGPLQIITYEPQTVDVQEYLRKEGYNTKVVEVANIQDALRFFIS